MSARARWECPNGCGAVLGPRRPRLDDVARFCLPCSAKAGRLVRRVAPALEAKREKAEARAKEKAAAKAERAKRVAAAAWTVGDLNLLEELRKVWAGKVARSYGATDRALPKFRLRRCSARPRSRLGCYRLFRHEIMVATWPGHSRGDLLDTLLHEIAHALVGHRRDGGWHGVAWKTCFRLLCEEQLGVRPRVENRYGGEVEVLLAERERSDEVAASVVEPKEEGVRS